MTRYIAKAKYSSGQVTIIEKDICGDSEKSIETVSKEEPAPEFIKAMNALDAAVREIISAPKGWTDSVSVYGVSWRWDFDLGIEGATICAGLTLPETGLHLLINTPFLPYDVEHESGRAKMPESAIELLGAFKTEVQAFLNGRRAQKDMFNN